MARILLSLAALVAATTTTSATCTNPSIRKPWTALTEDEKASYVNSTLCLMDPSQAPAKVGSWGATSRWEELVVAHIAQVRYIHTVGALFPWHRWYTKIHEDLLRNECGYTGPYPYWDQQTDQSLYPIQNASVWDTASTVTAFGTGRTDAATNCILDGAFTDHRVRFNTQLERDGTEGGGVCLTRALNQTAFDTVSQANVVEPCMALDKGDDYGEMLGCLGNTPHSGGHLGVGGIMRDHARSPADPIFYLHHTNFDRLWWEWQTSSPSRLYAMGGRNVAANQIFLDAQPKILPEDMFLPYFGDGGGNVTTLDHVLWMPGLAENITIRDTMDVHGDKMCFDYV
ncbi:amino acid transporter [Colletotrichum scovillei]|uniref:Amino acid transporter n=1 Tax=Colletotrichum scovillei TaxID=1209932 RepID=A0A9P7RI56_9PEZI|nr:amino acid transporter [Colletotrichum scovillei]KAG7076046.1 amino acid transporter [Colletotrichum scovillei]KAG7083134.1 amino acid transporter [Colletotrichum scovillei]